MTTPIKSEMLTHHPPYNKFNVDTPPPPTSLMSTHTPPPPPTTSSMLTPPPPPTHTTPQHGFVYNFGHFWGAQSLSIIEFHSIDKKVPLENQNPRYPL